MNEEKKVKKSNKFRTALYSVLFSIVFLYVFNMVGVYLNLHIPINIWTIAIVSILRIPGIVVLLIILAL